MRRIEWGSHKRISLRIVVSLLLAMPVKAMGQDPGTSGVDDATNAMISVTKGLSCAVCPASNIVPPIVSGILDAGCYKPTNDATKTKCAELAADLDSLAALCNRDDLRPANIEWEFFKKHFVDPCQPIPAKYLEPSNPRFLDLMRMIAPKIVLDANEEFRPKSIASILADIQIENSMLGMRRVFKDGTLTYPYSIKTRNALLKREAIAQESCSVPLVNGKCCGSLNEVPLYFDVRKNAGGGKAVSAQFVTMHRAGSPLGIGMIAGKEMPGTHLFDSEVAQLDYKIEDSGRLARLSSMKFSRHGSGVEYYEQICSNGRYFLPQYQQASHPVLFQSRGGHAFYLEASTVGTGRFAPLTTDLIEQHVERDRQTVEWFERKGEVVEMPKFLTKTTLGSAIHALGILFKDRTVSVLQENYSQKRCVTMIDPVVLSGIGTLWFDRRVGAASRHNFGTPSPPEDICVHYKALENSKRSIRYLAGWLEQDSRDISRFHCADKAPTK